MRSKTVTIHIFLKTLGPNANLLLIFFLSLPFCFLHLPGFSTPFGLIIALIGCQLGLSKQIWLPKFLSSKKLSPTFLKKTRDKGLWIESKLNRFMRPRLLPLCTSVPAKILNSAYIVLLSLFLALPLPIPTTNIGVAWPLVLISLGLLQDDGLFILFSYLIGLAYFGILIATVLLI